MSVFAIASNKPLSSVMEAHRRARARKAQLDRSRSAGLSLFAFPLIWLVERLERRAFRQFAAVRTTNPEDARLKLVYLMAVMMADRTSPGAVELASAIETLRPYKAALAEHLQRRTITPGE